MTSAMLEGESQSLDLKKCLTPKLSTTSSISSALIVDKRSLLPGYVSNSKLASELGLIASDTHQYRITTPKYMNEITSAKVTTRGMTDLKKRKEIAKLAKTLSCVHSSASEGHQQMICEQSEDNILDGAPHKHPFGTRLINSLGSNRGRSSSIDSDFGDYTIHGALTGLFPKNISSGIKSSLSNHLGRKTVSQGLRTTTARRANCAPATTATSAAMSAEQCSFAQNFTTLWSSCAKLPPLSDCTPNRKCCQKQFTSKRAQIELAKYKETLRN